MRKVCVILVDRANLGRLAPVLREIADHPDLELQIACAGSMLLDSYGQGGKKPVDLVRDMGFHVDAEIYCLMSGSNPHTMALSKVHAEHGFVGEFARLRPDIICMIGDRYEALAAASAAVTLRIPVFHIQGGEVSECADNDYRHMISKVAAWHWPATERAAENLLRMAEPPERIVGLGCPASDIPVAFDDEADGPIICIYHPNTMEFGTERQQMTQVLKALQGVPGEVLCWWSNCDAGGDDINKAIRVWMDEYKSHNDLSWFKTIKNLEPAEFQHMLANARVAVGNSSSLARDSVRYGTPVVLVGNRQAGREVGPNAIRVPCEKNAIRTAIETQLEHGRYPATDLYGDGCVSERIAEALATVDLHGKKALVLQ